MSAGHRRVLVDTPPRQIVRQFLAQDPQPSTRVWRAALARQIYEGLRPELEAFRQLPGVEIVPSRACAAWLPKQLPNVLPTPLTAPDSR